MRKARRAGAPLICTHELEYRNDQIIKALAQAGLENKKDDCVKVIFYPAYLTGTDRLLNLTMREAIQGRHLGVFPSYYEPRGYTPLEAAAEGEPAGTSDLSGLGGFTAGPARDEPNPGGFFVNNLGKSAVEVGESVGALPYDYGGAPPRISPPNPPNQNYSPVCGR